MRHSDPDENIVCLLRAIEHGDEHAARDVWERHYDSLVRMFGRWFGQRSRTITDEEDLAVDVLDDVIQRIQRAECQSIVLEREFTALLCATARHRFITQRRFDCRQKRLAGMIPLEVSPDLIVASGCGGPADDAFELEEELLSLLSIPHDNNLWGILILIVEGFSKPRIAIDLKMSRRSVDRLLLDLKRRWQKHVNGERVPKRVESWSQFVKLLPVRRRPALPPSPPRDLQREPVRCR
jgi:DNA-directed RNA polymerase specialized sigma24 family protein